MSGFSDLAPSGYPDYDPLVMKVRFLKSSGAKPDYPFPYKPEVAIVGRSNAGKSSFINALCGQKIAKVSATPGKTRLLNFFELDEKVYLVDMPGYGYATGDREEAKNWKHMIEHYLRNRDTLRGVLIIMDIRRDWGDEEEMMKDWLNHFEIEWGVILNKADKLSKQQILKRVAVIEKEIGHVPTYILSSLKKQNLDQVKNLILKDWPK